MSTDTPRYDTVGDQYRQYKTTATLPIAERRLFRDQAGDLTGQRVLDLATGYGAYARLAHDLGATEVVGVDISPEMIHHARRATDTPAVTFHTADARTTPNLGTFDLVTAVWLFNYAQTPADLAAMAAGAARALRPGGRLVAITINPGHDPAGPDWTPYGLTVRNATAAPGQRVLEIALLTPTGSIALSVSQWDTDIYAAAVREAGLCDLTWHLPVLTESEIAAQETGYWDTADANPFIAAFTAFLP
ncbi:methyltransferase domain-containing protein [Streptomyces sp. NPDC051133]|uniref:class I SAM-dependent methyltransferase n=1 Tax=Streptomyces sp. NPDC051133 TaxID=3155521 RepID=UPI00343D52E8